MTTPTHSVVLRARRRATRSETPTPAPSGDASSSGAPRLSLIGVKVDRDLRADIDDYAKTHGITRSRAAGQFLQAGRETLRSREGVAPGKAEEILEALEGVRTVVELLGPPSFGLMRLLAHWATQSGGLKVAEDELLAELRTVAGDEWEQALSEAERELHASLKAKSEGRS
jgi:hypothetical protein